jgi:hypothetical protein
MSLYLILAVPSFGVLITAVYFLDDLRERKSLLCLLYGFLMSIPAVLLSELLAKPVPRTFIYGDLLGYAVVYRYLQYFLLGLLGYHLVFGFRSVTKRHREELATPEFRSFLFFSGFYLVRGVLDAILHFREYNPAILFFSPTARLLLIITASVSLGWIYQEIDFRMVLGYLGYAAVGTVVCLIYPLFIQKQYILGAALTVLFLAGSFIMFHFYLHKIRGPGRREKIPIDKVR